MIETARSLLKAGEWDFSVFECSACGIDFFTEDHVPLTGVPGSARIERLLLPKWDIARSRAALHVISSTRH